jgi:peptidoglycan/xylan/chitin deacetylase (PgdA/CDA1 family)
VSWLGESAAIACLTFDVDAESAILVHGAEHAANASVMTHQAYGPRVGVPRLLELLADEGVPATFFVPGVTAERWPGTVEEILAAGHEVGHHSYDHLSPVDQPDERADLERGLAALDKFGVRPEGYRAPMWEATWRTPGLLAELGFAYDSSLFDADRPYVLQTDHGELVELCPHWSLDDWEQYGYLPRPQIGTQIESPHKVVELWTAELDAMRRHHCLFVLTCHPFLSGRPSRVEALRTVIQHALAAGDVEFLSMGDAAARAIADETVERRPLRPM